MPPAQPPSVKSIEEFAAFILELHKDNAQQQAQLRTLLLDFNERLAINEMSMKNADQARMLLLESLGRLNDRMDNLRDLPGEVNRMARDVSELKATVRTHEATFLQLQGGWAVAKYTWVGIASVAGALVSIATHFLLKRGG